MQQRKARSRASTPRLRPPQPVRDQSPSSTATKHHRAQGHQDQVKRQGRATDRGEGPDRTRSWLGAQSRVLRRSSDTAMEATPKVLRPYRQRRVPDSELVYPDTNAMVRGMGSKPQHRQYIAREPVRDGPSAASTLPRRLGPPGPAVATLRYRLNPLEELNARRADDAPRRRGTRRGGLLWRAHAPHVDHVVGAVRAMH